MEFRTTVKTGENRGWLHHSDSVVLLGSCFSDNMGGKLHGALIKAMVNPMGTLYNPMSIARGVQRLIADEPVAGQDLFMQGGVWNSYDFHSRHSMPDKQATIDHMSQRIHQGHEALRQAQLLTVTLGSAIIYRLKTTGDIVANCHKVPQHEFERKMATTEEMAQVLDEMLTALHAFNPDLRIILTVSPIRHIADGLDINSLSKASLRVAIHKAMTRHLDYCDYFPAYEIMMDDLRDYRFYTNDMVHPSDVAVEYIWQAFQATYLDDRSALAVARCERIHKRLQHRPMSTIRDVVERFNHDTASVVRNLIKEYPYLAEHPELQKTLQNIR
ncbi:MAG: GSCFA domain-containing protein [Muribaculaceae bacterium]|nr:GSCFA domain-containing protein [Muribaculaceae bacterium]